MGAWLIFWWCFALLVCSSGAIEKHRQISLDCIGVLLIAATLAMLAEVLRSLVMEVFANAKQTRAPAADVEVTTKSEEAGAPHQNAHVNEIPFSTTANGGMHRIQLVVG